MTEAQSNVPDGERSRQPTEIEVSTSQDLLQASGDEAGTAPGTANSDPILKDCAPGPYSWLYFSTRASPVSKVALSASTSSSCSQALSLRDYSFESGYQLARPNSEDSTVDEVDEFFRLRLPSLSLTIFASYHWLGFLTGDTVAHDARAASLFFANFQFIHEGTNYLASQAPPSPLQNFWSLAVEEQFYLDLPFDVHCCRFRSQETNARGEARDDAFRDHCRFALVVDTSDLSQQHSRVFLSIYSSLGTSARRTRGCFEFANFKDSKTCRRRDGLAGVGGNFDRSVCVRSRDAVSGIGRHCYLFFRPCWSSRQEGSTLWAALNRCFVFGHFNGLVGFPTPCIFGIGQFWSSPLNMPGILFRFQTICFGYYWP